MYERRAVAFFRVMIRLSRLYQEKPHISQDSWRPGWKQNYWASTDTVALLGRRGYSRTSGPPRIQSHFWAATDTVAIKPYMYGTTLTVWQSVDSETLRQISLCDHAKTGLRQLRCLDRLDRLQTQEDLYSLYRYSFKTKRIRSNMI
jgi:hypothetical protein